MKVKAKIDHWMSLLLWGFSCFFIGLGFVMPEEEILVYIFFILPTTFFMIWILLGSYYELREDELYMRIGPFFGRIKYENIKKIRLETNFLSSMALSIHRIAIEQRNKSTVRGIARISPINREEFFEELKRHCYNLEK